MVDNVAISPQTSAVSSSATSTQTQEAQASLTSDFETFLRMLTVQAENQDPLNPIDATEFSSQLATFSSVEQQVLTNELLRDMSATLSGNELDKLGDWIGKEGLVTAPVWYQGQPVVVRPEYAAGANSAMLSVVNSSGEVVQRFPFEASQESVVWSGLDENGNPLPSDAYRFEVDSYADEELVATTLAPAYSRIEEVRSTNGQTIIRMSDGTELTSDQISGLRQPYSG